MKFRVTFKDPDTLGDAIRDAVTAEVAAMPGLDDDERSDVTERRIRKVSDQFARFFRWGEYVTVECDTETGTVSVVPNC